MRRPLFKKKPEQEQPSPFFKKKNEDQFFPGTADQQKEQPNEAASDSVNSLSDETQQQMGAALGGDFSNVKIHTGPHAERMNRSMNSYAFTYGKDIYFNRNAFNENTREGKRLLAHELVHTMQQEKGKPDSDWSNDPAVEQKTDAFAENAVGTIEGKSGKGKSKQKENAMIMPTTGLKVQRCARAPSGGSGVPGMTWVVAVPKTGPGPGGWMTTRTMGGFLAQFPYPRNVECYMTIGVPLETFLGPVSEPFATDVAMSSIQAVGQQMQAEMSAGDPMKTMPSGLICATFRSRVQAAMSVAIPGTRVTQ